MKLCKSVWIWDKRVCSLAIPIYIFDAFTQISMQCGKIFQQIFSLEGNSWDTKINKKHGSYPQENYALEAKMCAQSVVSCCPCWLCGQFLSCVWLSVTPWTIARQAPLSLGFSRQECWSGLPCPPPGDLPDPGIQSVSPTFAARFFTAEPPGKPATTGATERV